MLRELDPKFARRLDLNFVFQAPSISRLSSLIYGIINPSQQRARASSSEELELTIFVDKYTSNFPSRPQTLKPRNSDGDVVLLTGTTGGFGCNILAHLSLDPSVKKVYAFNRQSGIPIMRQIQTMERQGLLEECMRCPKFRLVEGDLGQPKFGLSSELFAEVDLVPNMLHVCSIDNIRLI